MTTGLSALALMTHEDVRKLFIDHVVSSAHRKLMSEATVEVDDHGSLLQQLMGLLLTPFMHRLQFIIVLHRQLPSDFLLDEL